MKSTQRNRLEVLPQTSAEVAPLVATPKGGLTLISGLQRRTRAALSVANRWLHARARRAGVRCVGCGQRYGHEANFCPACGLARTAVAAPPQKVKRYLVRRFLAEAIDRVVPLPLVVLVFPWWAWVVLAYHLLCDAGGRSLGKRVCRLRIVTEGSRRPCSAGRGV
jgi:hypothetical protein